MKLLIISVLGFFSSVVFAQTSSTSLGSTAEYIHPAIGLSFGHLDEPGQSSYSGDSEGISLIDNIYVANSDWSPDIGIGVQRFGLNNGDHPLVGILNADTRYEFGNRWSAGPAADIFLNNGANFGSNANQAVFLGFVGYKGISLAPTQILKLGVKANTLLFPQAQADNFIGLAMDFSFRNWLQ